MSKIIFANNLFLFLIIRQFILISTDICSFPLSHYENNAINEISRSQTFHKEGNEDNPCHYIFSKYDEQIGINNNIKYPQIIISPSCINKLKENEPITDSELVIGKIFQIRKSEENSEYEVYDIINYNLYYFDGTTLQSHINDIETKCSQDDDITYYLPIIIGGDALKKKYESVIRQNYDSNDENNNLNYDIFNPKAKIYTDNCITITYNDASDNINSDDSFENYDTTLNNRRNYYYPGNIPLCPSGFSYKEIDKETYSVKCKTTLSTETNIINSDSESSSDIPHIFGSFKADADFKTSENDIYFSMDVFLCIKLPFTLRGFKRNYGSYLMLLIIFIVLICYVILFITGKHHLLSVMELLFNSNIKSMNYLKQNAINNNNINFNDNSMNLQGSNLNQIMAYDIKNINNLGLNYQGAVSNGQLMSNLLVGNNFLNNPNNDKLLKTKKNNMKNKERNNLMSKVDEQENDKESERSSKSRTYFKKNESQDIDIHNTLKKGKKRNLKLIEKNEKISKSSKKESEEENEEENESGEESESKESKIDYKNRNRKNENSNPPRKNGGSDEKENGRKDRRRKSNNPIEISLNVKDLRDMMFKDQFKKSESNGESEKKEEKKSIDKDRAKSKPNKKKNGQENNFFKNIKNGNNMPPNGFPFQFLPPPMGMMPYGMPPPYPYQNNGETEKLKKELEYQKELNERREREMRREREDMLEKERERQRQRDYDLDRERRLKDMQMIHKNSDDMDKFEIMLQKMKNDEKRRRENDSELLDKERERYDKMKEKLEKQIEKKKEENEKIQKDLDSAKEELKLKQAEYEKELLKINQELKEKKEIIETKDKEIQILKEDKDKELQKLKEDKEHEIDVIKKDMEIEIRKKDNKIKKKEKVIEKQKKETKELKKDLTSNNTFYSNNLMNGSTFRQNFNLDMGIKKREEEKIESPQVVVSINSIFTDHELNAMSFEQSCQFDRRTLCQVYFSFINRKQPLFFFFNYNSSSTGISIFQINYQSIRFIFICVDFMIYLFFYCTFFGSKSVSLIFEGKYNLRRMCILGIIISPFCLIIRSIIHYFIYDPMNRKIAEIKIRCYTNFTVGKKKEEVKVNEFKDFWESEGGEEKNKEDKEEIEKKEEIDEIQDIENDENLCEEEKIRRKDKYEKRRLKQLIKEVIKLFEYKVFISFWIMLGVMIFEWVYVSCFCAVYKNSQLRFFVSIFICYGFSNLIPFIYCLVPTFFKQDAIRDESKFSFFIANIFQMI